MGIQLTDEQYRILILRTLAYLVMHPEIDAHLEWREDVNLRARDWKSFTIGVDANVFWRTEARLMRAYGKPQRRRAG